MLKCEISFLFLFIASWKHRLLAQISPQWNKTPFELFHWMQWFMVQDHGLRLEVLMFISAEKHANVCWRSRLDVDNMITWFTKGSISFWNPADWKPNRNVEQIRGQKWIKLKSVGWQFVNTWHQLLFFIGIFMSVKKKHQVIPMCFLQGILQKVLPHLQSGCSLFSCFYEACSLSQFYCKLLQ